MDNFRFVAQLDTFAVVAGLYRRQDLFGNGIAARREGMPGLPVKSILLRGPAVNTPENWVDDLPCEDLPALQGWKAMQRLLLRARRAIGADAVLGKVMVSRLEPMSAIGWHADSGPYHDAHIRFHIPLLTACAPGAAALVYVEAETIHMPVGALYWMANRRLHSAANWTPWPRVHVVLDVRKPPAD